MKKVLWFLGLAGLFVFVVGELIGRYYGLTSFPLFVASPKFEYITAPNQDVYIYRRHFLTNQYSQRSAPYQPSDTLVYLLIGDSIVNGGNLIDQDSTASSILEQKLQRQTHKPIRVLNISAKSWGPDNAAAYIRTYGTFSADKMVLVVSSHDAYDVMTFKPVVGLDDNYPAKNAGLAWSKVIAKGWPAIAAKLGVAPVAIDTAGLTQPNSASMTKTWPFNSGFDSFRQLTDSLHIPFLVYHHRTVEELRTGKLEPGGQEIQAYCKKYHIRLIEPEEAPGLYQDYIHFNERGQRFLSDQLSPFLLGTE